MTHKTKKAKVRGFCSRVEWGGSSGSRVTSASSRCVDASLLLIGEIDRPRVRWSLTWVSR
jgi:hypothetical protein